MDDVIFNLKLTNRQLEKMAKKADAEERKERAKVVKAIKDKDVERGRVFAENAIRKRNESLNFLRMASRIDGVVSRLQTAQSMKSVVAQMGGVVKGLDKAMQSMDLFTLSKIMDKFESQFSDLDTRTAVMENSMAGATSISTPVEEVDSLMRQVAEENALDVQQELSKVSTPSTAVGAATHVEALSHEDESELSRRLAALRS